MWATQTSVASCRIALGIAERLRYELNVERLSLDDISATWAFRVANGRGADLGGVEFADHGHSALRIGDIEVPTSLTVSDGIRPPMETYKRH